MRHLLPENVSELLYKLTSRALGSRSLITATVKRVELDSHLITALSPETICQSLVALNLAGVDPAKEEFCAYVSSLASPDALSKLTREEHAVLDKLCHTIQTSAPQQI